MPPQPKAPRLDRDGYVTDPVSGLDIPRSYQFTRNVIQTTLAQVAGGSAIGGKGYARGYPVERDPDTLIVRWPEKGTGWDDFVNQSLVDGTIANIGLAPVVQPQISAMVKRHQDQAATATIALTGRPYPTMKARDAIARFNDSPLGATNALQKVAYALCTYNRGAPIASVPIIYAMEKWAENGMEAIPIPKPVEKSKIKQTKSDLSYLSVNWEKHGTPIPYLPSVFDLEPSGIPEWPYWYRARDRANKTHWVLLHQTHILQFTSGVSGTAGIGTSPVWMCLGILAEQILVLEARAEQAAYTMTDGITLLGGVEGSSGGDIKERIEAARADALARGFITMKGQTILTSPMADKVSIAQVSFRQNLTDFQAWREYQEDVIAFCFGEALSAMVTRGGVGYGAQAATGADNAADTGISAILYQLSMALGAIYSRVQVSISRPNDRAQRLNIDTLEKFSTASKDMIDRGVYTAQETRAIIDRDILSIPVLENDTVTVTPNSDDPSVSGPATAPPQPAPAPAPVAKPVVKPVLKTAAEILETARRAQLAVRFKDGPVTVTDDDTDRAVTLAGERIGSELEGLLVAEKG